MTVRYECDGCKGLIDKEEPEYEVTISMTNPISEEVNLMEGHLCKDCRTGFITHIQDKYLMLLRRKD